MDEQLARQKAHMLEHDLRGRDITDERVLAAMARLPRELFVMELDRHRAYDDSPLYIACGQTISQPYMVALMTQKLQLTGEERVLEIGTGSGYQAAVLAELAREVYTIDRHEQLSTTAEDRLERLGYTNIFFKVGDGTLGWPEQAPFDRIMVTAGAPRLPPSLVDQLAENGRLVVPVGKGRYQTLTISTKQGGKLKTERSIDCVFVKLIGAEGHPKE